MRFWTDIVEPSRTDFTYDTSRWLKFMELKSTQQKNVNVANRAWLC